MTDTFHSYVLDPLERAASTFVQQFVVILLATGSAGLVEYQAWGKAADAALFAAILSIGTSVLTFWVPPLAAGPDLAWRVAKTFIQSFLGVLIAAGVSSTIHANWKDALATAIPVALTALLKGLAALAAPWSTGASLLPNPPVTYGEPLGLAEDAEYLDSLAAGDPAENGAVRHPTTDSQLLGHNPTTTTGTLPEPENPPVG